MTLVYSVDNAYGLAPLNERTPPTPQRTLDVLLESDASKLALISLSKLFEETFADPSVVREHIMPLGELRESTAWLDFPKPNTHMSAADNRTRVPLLDLWLNWNRDRGSETRDRDGFELYRAIAYKYQASQKGFTEPHVNCFAGADIARWITLLDPPSSPLDFLLDAVETTVTSWKSKYLNDKRRTSFGPFAQVLWYEQLAAHRLFRSDEWTIEQHARLFGLMRWLDEPGCLPGRARARLEDFLPAYYSGVASDADLADYLVGPRGIQDEVLSGEVTHQRTGGSEYAFRELTFLTAPQPREHMFFPDEPVYLYGHARENAGIQAVIRSIGERVVDAVFAADDDTDEMHAASALQATGGLDVLVRCLTALRDVSLKPRSYSSDLAYQRANVLTHVLTHTRPNAADTHANFAVVVQAADIAEALLLETAFAAPQWARLIAQYLAWPGLEDAFWWIRAHALQEHLMHERDLEDEMNTVAPWTSVAVDHLRDGACDAAWFRRLYEDLSAARWEQVAAASRLLVNSDTARALLFADALRGKVTHSSLVKRALEKRHQNSARALGLCPLPDGPAPQRVDKMFQTYNILQEYILGSRRYGVQRRANERLAASIGIENLAANAGYADSTRLELAMEIRSAELHQGAQNEIDVDGVSVQLLIDDFGAASVIATRAGKRLKSVPASATKDPGVISLLERKSDITKQAARVTRSLETAMNSQSEFEVEEVINLLGHPVIAPKLRNLIFVDEHGRMGYPTGEGLADLDDVILYSERLRVAHPYDLLRDGNWARRQRECFLRERIQPFKQVFRELYVVTDAERESATVSRRYDGNIVRQTSGLGLLKARGWVASMFEDDATRTFHWAGVQARLKIDRSRMGFGLTDGSFRLGAISFVSRRDASAAISFTEVPPLIFSESMRDIDLVVSVAAMSQEALRASDAVIESRAALVREALELLKLRNARIDERRVVITGTRATYSVHLGSGSVHVEPGGHLCIIPDTSVPMGRLFLPFADPDPQSALIIAKTILLSNDAAITDPVILEQLNVLIGGARPD